MPTPFSTMISSPISTMYGDHYYKDIEYNIPLNFGENFMDMYFNPPRNYTNPQTLESFEKGVLDDLFTIQGIKL